MKQEYFEVGQIVNTFGIKGQVKVKPFTDDLERFEELKSVLVEKGKELIEMQIEYEYGRKIKRVLFENKKGRCKKAS